MNPHKLGDTSLLIVSGASWRPTPKDIPAPSLAMAEISCCEGRMKLAHRSVIKQANTYCFNFLLLQITVLEDISLLMSCLPNDKVYKYFTFSWSHSPFWFYHGHRGWGKVFSATVLASVPQHCEALRACRNQGLVFILIFPSVCMTLKQPAELQTPCTLSFYLCKLTEIIFLQPLPWNHRKLVNIPAPKQQLQIIA